jgi:4-amino-4-deoxy-L-arabinose transferase-like glycosyltransferase
VGALLFAGIAAVAILYRQGAGTSEPSPTFRREQFLAVTGMGLALRILWMVLVPPVQTSDFHRYMGAARNLLATHTYFEDLLGHHFRAFTPPGLPFFLAMGIGVLGDHSWVPGLLNCSLYILSSVAIAVMASRAAGWSVASWAVFLFAIWPSDIALTGLAASEPLFLCLFLFACLFLFLPEPTAFRWSAACGIAAGFATLTRPTALTTPILWIGMLLLLGRGSRKAKSVAVATLLMILTVVPWAIRNDRVLGTLVPVSTNGGDVFYRANNPLATGSWTAKGERDLSPYLGDEVRWNQMGFAWGKEWIASHPSEFLKLAVKKQNTFLGSDETGEYWALERAYPEKQQAGFIGKWVSDLWWFLLWIALAFSMLRYRRDFLHTPELTCLLLPFLYFLFIHSVFESQDRYHIPGVPFVLIICALAFASRRASFREGAACNSAEASN